MIDFNNKHYKQPFLSTQVSKSRKSSRLNNNQVQLLSCSKISIKHKQKISFDSLSRITRLEKQKKISPNIKYNMRQEYTKLKDKNKISRNKLKKRAKSQQWKSQIQKTIIINDDLMKSNKNIADLRMSEKLSLARQKSQNKLKKDKLNIIINRSKQILNSYFNKVKQLEQKNKEYAEQNHKLRQILIKHSIQQNYS